MIVGISFIKPVRGLGPDRARPVVGMRAGDGYTFEDQGTRIVITRAGTASRRIVPLSNLTEFEEVPDEVKATTRAGRALRAKPEESAA